MTTKRFQRKPIPPVGAGLHTDPLLKTSVVATPFDGRTCNALTLDVRNAAYHYVFFKLFRSAVVSR